MTNVKYFDKFMDKLRYLGKLEGKKFSIVRDVSKNKVEHQKRDLNSLIGFSDTMLKYKEFNEILEFADSHSQQRKTELEIEPRIEEEIVFEDA